jgi:hypothetical protein
MTYHHPHDHHEEERFAASTERIPDPSSAPATAGVFLGRGPATPEAVATERHYRYSRYGALVSAHA